MQPVIDPDAVREMPPAAPPAHLPAFAHLPDLHEPPKRRMHPMLVGACGFALAAAGFYGAEALAPMPLKPSTFIGGYANEMAEAQKSGELKAQARYEGQLRGIELQYQGQLKDIETAAVQWQENYKTQLNGQLEDYRNVWKLAGIYAQGTVDANKLYLSSRLTARSWAAGLHPATASATPIIYARTKATANTTASRSGET